MSDLHELLTTLSSGRVAVSARERTLRALRDRIAPDSVRSELSQGTHLVAVCGAGASPSASSSAPAAAAEPGAVLPVDWAWLLRGCAPLVAVTWPWWICC
jgi:hypothetical protein